MDSTRLRQLLMDHANGTASDQGLAELVTYLQASKGNDLDFLIEEAWVSSNDDAGALFRKEQGAAMLARILQAPQPVVHKVHYLRTAWLRYAAILLLVLGTGAYFFYTNRLQQPTDTIAQGNHYQPAIAPGTTGAVLTLADGRKVVLDSLGNGVVAVEKGAQVLLENGQLKYDAAGASAVSYNTMTTPKGRQFQIVLPDGSKVWLNAASSICYPTSFVGKDRIINVTGEAYFEVAKDKTKPFIVKTSSDEIRVLGTKFNVHAYSEEPEERVSLLEGSIQVANTLLKPGQAYSGGQIIASNLEQDLAWKNGIFDFNNVKLEDAMRQLARWYDLEVIYEKGIPNFSFGGKIGRDTELPALLKTLTSLGVHYRMGKERQLIILP